MSQPSRFRTNDSLAKSDTRFWACAFTDIRLKIAELTVAAPGEDMIAVRVVMEFDDSRRNLPVASTFAGWLSESFDVGETFGRLWADWKFLFMVDSGCLAGASHRSKNRNPFP